MRLLRPLGGVSVVFVSVAVILRDCRLWLGLLIWLLLGSLLRSFLSSLLSSFLSLFGLFHGELHFLLGLLFPVLTVGVSDAELSLIIEAPAVDTTLQRSRDAVVLSASKLDDVVALEGVEVLDASWLAAVEQITNAQLTSVVEPPGEHLVLVVDVEAVHVAAKDVNSVFGTSFLHFHAVLIFVSGVDHPSNLARIRVSPSEDLSAGGERQGVLLTTCNLFDSGLGMLVEELCADHNRFDLLLGGLS